MPSNAEYIAIEQKYYAQTVRRRPVVIVRGEGSRVWDADGKEYIDFVAGWAVDNLGHCPPVVVDAIARQAATLIQTSNQFYTLPQLDIAATLIETRVWTGCFSATAARKPWRAPSKSPAATASCIRTAPTRSSPPSIPSTGAR